MIVIISLSRGSSGTELRHVWLLVVIHAITKLEPMLDPGTGVGQGYIGLTTTQKMGEGHHVLK